MNHVSQPSSLSMVRIAQVAVVAAIAFLLPAAFDAKLPYTYYTNLRWVVFRVFPAGVRERIG